MGRTNKQKMNKEIEDVNKTINNWLEITNIARTLHTATTEHMFVSGAYGIFSKIDHIFVIYFVDF